MVNSFWIDFSVEHKKVVGGTSWQRPSEVVCAAAWLLSFKQDEKGTQRQGNTETERQTDRQTEHYAGSDKMTDQKQNCASKLTHHWRDSKNLWTGSYIDPRYSDLEHLTAYSTSQQNWNSHIYQPIPSQSALTFHSELGISEPCPPLHQLPHFWLYCRRPEVSQGKSTRWGATVRQPDPEQ